MSYCHSNLDNVLHRLLVALGEEGEGLGCSQWRLQETLTVRVLADLGGREGAWDGQTYHPDDLSVVVSYLR